LESDPIRGSQTIYDALGRAVETRRIEHLDVQLVDDPINPGRRTTQVANLAALVTLYGSSTEFDDAQGG
jgi:hypothetical protein